MAETSKRENTIFLFFASLTTRKVEDERALLTRVYFSLGGETSKSISNLLFRSEFVLLEG